ncbi:MAG: hypothetical protein IJ435_04040 [Clostridia bacterium]|nr:hypothetical protein [Clostridia bacterium]
MEKYDFIKFINSKDIRAHLKKTGYELSERECAYVVCESYLPLKQKHEAYGELIKNTSDEMLKETLAKRIELEKILLDVFFQRDNAVYVYRYISKGDRECEEIYASCARCMESAFQWNERAKFVRVRKRWVMGEDSESKEVSVLVNKEGEVINIASRGILSEELCEEFWSIVNLWQEQISIPLPFERGDILYTITDGVFVYENEWEESHMDGYMHNCYDCEEAVVGVYRIIRWLDAEYYTGRLKGKEKKLKDISAFLKGKMKLVDFIQSCRQMK